MAYTDPEIARRIAGYVRVLEDAFESALAKAQEQGEISTKLGSRDLARSLINMIQGVALLAKVLRDPEMARGVIRSSLVLLEAG